MQILTQSIPNLPISVGLGHGDLTLFCDRYYNGVQTVQQWLVDAVSQAMSRQAISDCELDEICGFGAVRSSDKLPLHHSADFKRDSNLMNSLVFSLASNVLDLTLEKAIPKRLSLTQKQEVVSYIKTQELKVSGCGSHGSTRIPLVKCAEMFAQLKALNEIDSYVLATAKG